MLCRAHLCISIAYLFQLSLSESVWMTKCEHCYNSSYKNDHSLLKKCRTKRQRLRKSMLHERRINQINHIECSNIHIFVYAYFAFYFTAMALFIWPFQAHARFVLDAVFISFLALLSFSLLQLIYVRRIDLGTYFIIAPPLVHLLAHARTQPI